MRKPRFMLLIGPILLASCVYKSGTETAKTYRIPWQDSQHHYSLQDVNVETFSEPQYLRGDLAEFFIQPDLLFDEGHAAQPGTPSGRFVQTPSGSSLALDPTSMQAVAVYAHIERLHQLDVSSGAAEFLPKRASVGINVGLKTADDQLIENNAQYNPSVDSLLIVPYTDTDLPIVFNAGVIAHEHFHQIFQKMVLSDFQVSKTYLSENINEPNTLPKPPESAPHSFTSTPSISIDQYNRYILRGINEGLADFWGWLYSGDDTFVGRSLSSSLEIRRLDRKNQEFYTADFFKIVLSGSSQDQMRLSMAYFLGSQYAVYLHNITLKIFNGNADADSRAKMARVLVLSLPGFKEELKAKISTEYLAPEAFVKGFIKSLQLNSDAPNLKGFDFCKSFREVAPAATQSSSPTSCVQGAQ